MILQWRLHYFQVLLRAAMGGDAELDGVAQRRGANVLLAERLVGRTHHLRIVQQVQESRASSGHGHQGRLVDFSLKSCHLLYMFFVMLICV